MQVRKVYFFMIILFTFSCGSRKEEVSKPKKTKVYTQSYSFCGLDKGPYSSVFRTPRKPSVVKLKLDFDQFEELKEVILNKVPIQSSSYLTLIETLPSDLSSDLDRLIDKDYFKYDRIEGINYFKNFAAFMLFYLSRDLNITEDQIFRAYANLNKDIDSTIYLEVSFNDRDEDKVQVFRRPFCELRLNKSIDNVYNVTSRVKYIKTKKSL
ncbi:hypothetical protein N9N67_03055 [Bacteriovoracaceae bacterium]|nr:hypothetical protein [Bacteriovoracaceae bacterium]